MTEGPHYIHDIDALVTAALSGDYDIVRRLVEAGADINVRDELGRTALMVAVDETYSGIVKYLLEHGAEPNISDCDGDTPLDVAKYSSLFRVYGDTEIVDLLVVYGAKGKDGPSVKEERDDLIYEAFDSANAAKRLISEIKKKNPP